MTTKSIFSVLVGVSLAACSGATEVNPTPTSSASDVRTITAADLEGKRPLLDLTLPSVQGVIDGAREPVDLGAIDVRTGSRITSVDAWLASTGKDVPQVLTHGRLTLGGAGAGLADGLQPQLRRGSGPGGGLGEIDCNYYCETDGTCIEVCTIPCTIMPDGSLECEDGTVIP